MAYGIDFNVWKANPMDYAGESMETADGREVTIEALMTGIRVKVGDYTPQVFRDMTAASYYLNQFDVQWEPAGKPEQQPHTPGLGMFKPADELAGITIKKGRKRR